MPTHVLPRGVPKPHTYDYNPGFVIPKEVGPCGIRVAVAKPTLTLVFNAQVTRWPTKQDHTSTFKGHLGCMDSWYGRGWEGGGWALGIPGMTKDWEMITFDGIPEQVMLGVQAGRR